MGLTSGRGSHAGARRAHGTSLVGGERQEQVVYPSAPAGRRARAGRGRRRGVGGLLSGYSAPVTSVIVIIVCAAVVAAGIGVSHVLTAQSAADQTADPNCTLIVPANPLSAQGLATPYQLTATDPAAGPCNESNANQTAFVQGAVINPATGHISVYNPLVIDAGTQPAAAPVVPTLPAGAVVALWFGFNGGTLSLAGADQHLNTGTATATANGTQTATATATPTGAGSATATGSATPAASVTATGGGTASATPSVSATATGSPASSATATGSAAATAQGTATPSTASSTASATASSASSSGGGSAQVISSAPLLPDPASSSGWLNASLSKDGGSATGGTRQHTSPTTSTPATSSPAASSGAANPATSAGTPTTSSGTRGNPTSAASNAAPTVSATAATGGTTVTDPPTSASDSAAASGTADAILQQANCVAGESINGQFTSFTQVGACNAPAFFTAANKAIAAHQLTVPAPGTAKDGQACLTTRSFALIDQDQSDNVTTEYLATGNGQVAQDTAANRTALTGTTTLVNGSDNGLLDLFVDPALGCSPWEEPNLGDNGALSPALPLDELQAAAWAGRDGSGPAALVPLNDPMTLDGNGNFSTDKTNTYRSLVDMPALPAGESPAAYCSDMEQIQGARLQQDVNLLINGPSPMPGAASNLFTFLAMRLQQSFTNLNCGSFGLSNDVSTTTDGNGIVVNACFVHQVAAATAGHGNPMAGTRYCPATVGAGTTSTSQSGHGSGQYSNGQYPGGMSKHQVQSYWQHHHHG